MQMHFLDLSWEIRHLIYQELFPLNTRFVIKKVHNDTEKYSLAGNNASEFRDSLKILESNRFIREEVTRLMWDNVTGTVHVDGKIDTFALPRWALQLTRTVQVDRHRGVFQFPVSLAAFTKLDLVVAGVYVDPLARYTPIRLRSIPEGSAREVDWYSKTFKKLIEKLAHIVAGQILFTDEDKYAVTHYNVFEVTKDWRYKYRNGWPGKVVTRVNVVDHRQKVGDKPRRGIILESEYRADISFLEVTCLPVKFVKVSDEDSALSWEATPYGNVGIESVILDARLLNQEAK